MTDVATTRRGAVLVLACLAQFMVVLDVAIVNVALPSIQADLGLEQDALQWVVVAYGLMLGGFLLLGGRLADLLGRRRVLLTGLALFTASSLLAGLAGEAWVLIGARALQGFGAALIPPAALSILAVTFADGAERNRALGLYGATAGVSATVGVLASGLLTDGPGWRWIFLLNVPVGIGLVALAATLLPADRPGRRDEPFDTAGAVTVTAGLLVLVYALSRADEAGWASASTIGLLAGSAVLLGLFVLVESRSRSPLVPAAALRSRTMLAADLTAFFTFGAFFAYIFLGSLLMQQVLGYSPTRTGVAWLATTLISFVAAAATGNGLAERLGVRRLLVVGQALLAVAALLLTRVDAGARFATDLLPSLLLAGLAVGAAAPAIQIGALAGVRPSLTGLVSGLVETMREVGGAVGVAGGGGGGGGPPRPAAPPARAAGGAWVAAATPPGLPPAAAGAYPERFVVIAVAAATGAAVAAVAFPREAGARGRGRPRRAALSSSSR